MLSCVADEACPTGPAWTLEEGEFKRVGRGLWRVP